MKKGYKKIDFTRLHNLVSNVDYIDETSFPVVFSVNGKEFVCGLDSVNEQQFLAAVDDNGSFIVIDLQEPDDMVFDEIGRMLKEKCHITPLDYEKIWLNSNISFTGVRHLLINEIKRYKKTIEKENNKKYKQVNSVSFNTQSEGLDYVYNKVLRRAGRPFGCTVMTNYYHVDPKPVALDNGKVLNVEWLQPSSFNTDVLINWKTDRIKASCLSVKELEQLATIV